MVHSDYILKSSPKRILHQNASISENSFIFILLLLKNKVLSTSRARVHEVKQANHIVYYRQPNLKFFIGDFYVCLEYSLYHVVHVLVILYVGVLFYHLLHHQNCVLKNRIGT